MRHIRCCHVLYISHTFRGLTVVQRNHWAAETKGTIAIELASQIRRIGLGVTDELGIFARARVEPPRNRRSLRQKT